jgi:hypothetical protein
MTMVSIRIPDDVIDDLKRVAPMLGFSGYQALGGHPFGRGWKVVKDRQKQNVEVE